MIPTTFAYFNSPTEWLIIGGLVILLFGGTKLAQLGKGLGEGIREFKKSVSPDDEANHKTSEIDEDRKDK